jgi:hypothetical protein
MMMQERNERIGEEVSSANVLSDEPTDKNDSVQHFKPITQRRGRRALDVPSERHLSILRALSAQTYEQVASTRGISRQRVGQIVKRWKRFLPDRTLRSQKNALSESTAELRVKKEKRVHVVSFRLTDAEFQLLQLRYPEMKSPDRAARGIVTRFLSL